VLAVLRILIVDDNEDGAESLGRILTLHGHSIALAFDGRSAIRCAREVLPDLILIDIGLPDISGFEVAQQLRDDANFSECMLVALSGWSAASHMEMDQSKFFDRYLMKPASAEEVQAVVRECALRQSRAQH
jgi:DNA-binding response OmpR family regulator